MTAAAFQATYSDWRLIKGRKVIQVVLEVPLEGAGLAYTALGGMPDPSKEVWCAVARLNSGKDGEAHGPATPPVDKTPASVADIPVRARKPVAADKRLAQQAGILCSDPVFQTFLYEHDSATEKSEEAAATAVRMICSVQSRADIIPGTYAAEQFDKLVSKFTAWRLAA